MCLKQEQRQFCSLPLARGGGILEAKKIAGMAESHYAQVAPHLYCGPVEGAANIQISTCTPNFLILEGIRRWEGFHAQILKKPVKWDSRVCDSSDRTRTWRGVKRGSCFGTSYNEKDLHLEMAEKPIH
ncbi:MAG: hypothetical protein Ct9H300mP28_22530 [Pseudomonadota bacterium]|nr:MAG: hypothetical protein Ct9H300mP28_22530 [Pseudomonadota bacterium]